MSGVVNPARKGKVVERATSTLQPSQDAGASGCEKLELHGSAGLVLHDRGPGASPTAADQIADLEPDEVAAAQLAVDRELGAGLTTSS